MITFSVPIAGVLLVFSFLVVPAAIAFQFTRRQGALAVISWLAGALASAGGLWSPSTTICRPGRWWSACSACCCWWRTGPAPGRRPAQPGSRGEGRVGRVARGHCSCSSSSWPRAPACPASTRVMFHSRVDWRFGPGPLRAGRWLPGHSGHCTLGRTPPGRGAVAATDARQCAAPSHRAVQPPAARLLRVSPRPVLPPARPPTTRESLASMFWYASGRSRRRASICYGRDFDTPLLAAALAVAACSSLPPPRCPRRPVPLGPSHRHDRCRARSGAGDCARSESEDHDGPRGSLHAC